MVFLALAEYLKTQGIESLGDAFGTDWHSVWDRGSGIGQFVYKDRIEYVDADHALLKRITEQRRDLIQKYRGRYFFKVMPGQVDEATFQSLAQDHDVIVIERRNLFKQALSFFLANHTGKWSRVAGEDEVRQDPRSIEGDLYYLDAFEALYWKFHEWKALLPRKRVIYYEDFQSPITAAEVISSALGVRSEDIPAGIGLPLKQSSVDPLSLFRNQDEIISWYRGSSLQERWPIDLLPGKDKAPARVDYLFLFYDLPASGLTYIQRCHVDAVRRILPDAKIGIAFAGGFSKNRLESIPVDVRVVRFRNTLMEATAAGLKTSLRSMLEEVRPSVLHLIESRMHQEAVDACKEISGKAPKLLLSELSRLNSPDFYRKAIHTLAGVFTGTASRALMLKREQSSAKFGVVYLPVAKPVRALTEGSVARSGGNRVLIHFCDEFKAPHFLGTLIADAAPGTEFHVHNFMIPGFRWPRNVVEVDSSLKMDDYFALIWVDRWSGVPDLVFEAFSKGVPVIAVDDCSNNRELINEETGYLVSHETAIREYSACLSEIRCRPDLVRKKTEAARELLMRRHSGEAFTESLRIKIEALFGEREQRSVIPVVPVHPLREMLDAPAP